MSARDYCYTCLKPAVSCICDGVEPVRNRTRVTIVQHKCERAHPIGTARIAELGLERSRLLQVWPDREGRFTFGLDSGPRTGLLYPGPGARDLSTLEPADRPEELIVLDGTWADARALYRDNPWLAGLPRYGLEPSIPSRYRIRKEPNARSVSTIEAIAGALEILEPETVGLDALLTAFETMIDTQIRLARPHLADPAARRAKRPRQREIRSVFPAQLERFERIVLADGETVPRAGKDRGLIRWAAVRPADGATFDRMVMPTRDAVVTDDHLELMRIPRSELGGAVDRRELGRQWERFLGPTDVVVTWNKSTLDLFAEQVDTTHPRFFLKETYCNLTQRRCGHLRDVVEAEGLAGEEPPVPGRAGQRLAWLATVAEHLNRLDTARLESHR